MFKLIIFIFLTLLLKDGQIFHRVIHHHDDREATFCAAMRMLPQGSHHCKWRSQIANWKEDENLDNVTNGCMFSSLQTLKKWLMIKMTFQTIQKVKIKMALREEQRCTQGHFFYIYKPFDVPWADSYSHPGTRENGYKPTPPPSLDLLRQRNINLHWLESPELGL